MADRISWIKNLLGYGTSAEQAAVKNVRQHMVDTGNEKLIIGPTHGRADLSDTLSNTGGKSLVDWPPGHDLWNQKMAAQGEPIYSAHSHPMRSTIVPSPGDIANWSKDYYVPGVNKQGTYAAPDKYARETMWIAGGKDPNLVSMMPPLEYGSYSDTYEILRKLRDANATWEMKLRKDPVTGRWPLATSIFRTDFDDFAKPWLKQLSPEEYVEAYGNMATGLLANKMAEAAPIHIDPKGTLVRGHDLPIGDLWPEFDKYVEKRGNPIFKAHGGQYDEPMPPFPTYGSQHFDKGGPVLPAITGLKAMQDYAAAIADIFKKPITVAAPPTAWPQIVKDGRFKTQFETGTSEGTLSPSMRRRTERELFDYPDDLDPTLRPIYGHIADLSDRGTQSYGSWGAVIDPSVKARSTFFLDDSLSQARGLKGPYKFSEGFDKQKDNLDQWIRKTLGYPMPDDVLTTEGHMTPRPFKPDEPVTAGRLRVASSIPYIETQTHGGLPWSDVSAMVGKTRVHDPDIAAANAQRIADITGKQSFASWAKGILHPTEWMRAAPGESVNNVLSVPEYDLKRFGLAEGGPVPAALPGQNAIRWIQNLLGQATTPEKEMIANVRKHAEDTGNEKIMIGSTWPRVIPETLSRTGGPHSVGFPKGYNRFMVKAGKEGAEVSSAHPHPTGLAVPSAGDLAVWANWKNYPGTRYPGTMYPADKIARQRMWITGNRGPDDLTMVDPMPYTGRDYQTVEQMRSDWGRFNRRESDVYGSQYKDMINGRIEDFTRDWRLNPHQMQEVYRGMRVAPLAHRIADQAPLHMDPASRLISDRPDLPLGDVWPEWMRYLDKRDIDMFKAEGGQVEGFQAGGFYEAPDRFSIPPSQFTAPRGVTTPTIDIPIGKGQATAGFSYDPESRLIDAILGIEHPLGKRGAKLGVTGNFNKDVGPYGNEAPVNWGISGRLTLPFAEGGQHDPYDDIAEAVSLMGAYK